jgi:hypothetical protein
MHQAGDQHGGHDLVALDEAATRQPLPALDQLQLGRAVGVLHDMDMVGEDNGRRLGATVSHCTLPRSGDCPRARPPP